MGPITGASAWRECLIQDLEYLGIEQMKRSLK